MGYELLIDCQYKEENMNSKMNLQQTRQKKKMLKILGGSHHGGTEFVSVSETRLFPVIFKQL